MFKLRAIAEIWGKWLRISAKIKKMSSLLCLTPFVLTLVKAKPPIDALWRSFSTIKALKSSTILWEKNKGHSFSWNSNNVKIIENIVYSIISIHESLNESPKIFFSLLLYAWGAYTLTRKQWSFSKIQVPSTINRLPAVAVIFFLSNTPGSHIKRIPPDRPLASLLAKLNEKLLHKLLRCNKLTLVTLVYWRSRKNTPNKEQRLVTSPLTPIRNTTNINL